MTELPTRWRSAGQRNYRCLPILRNGHFPGGHHDCEHEGEPPGGKRSEGTLPLAEAVRSALTREGNINRNWRLPHNESSDADANRPSSRHRRIVRLFGAAADDARLGRRRVEFLVFRRHGAVSKFHINRRFCTAPRHPRRRPSRSAAPSPSSLASDPASGRRVPRAAEFCSLRRAHKTR